MNQQAAFVEYINKLISARKYTEARHILRFLHAMFPQFMHCQKMAQFTDNFHYSKGEIVNVNDCVLEEKDVS